jgi:hypothetical protein
MERQADNYARRISHEDYRWGIVELMGCVLPPIWVVINNNTGHDVRIVTTFDDGRRRRWL